MVYDVVTFGSAVVDTFVNTDTNEKHKDICYPIGSKILIQKLKFDIGGGATNTGVAFARLGLNTGCICKLGNDENAQKILNLLKKENIKFLGKIDDNAQTGYSVILNSNQHNRTILTFKGANNDLKFNELNLKKIKTKWLYYSSVLGSSFETQKKLAIELKSKGVKLAFNPSEYLIRNKNLSSLLEITDVLILNKEEAEILTKKMDLLKGLNELGPKIVVVTNRDNFVKCSDGQFLYTIKPHKIKVKERTGAGDAFASGFVAGIIAEKSIEDSLKLGLMESENVIKYWGAKNNLLKFDIKKIKEIK